MLVSLQGMPLFLAAAVFTAKEHLIQRCSHLTSHSDARWSPSCKVVASCTPPENAWSNAQVASHVSSRILPKSSRVDILEQVHLIFWLQYARLGTWSFVAVQASCDIAAVTAVSESLRPKRCASRRLSEVLAWCLGSLPGTLTNHSGTSKALVWDLQTEGSRSRCRSPQSSPPFHHRPRESHAGTAASASCFTDITVAALLSKQTVVERYRFMAVVESLTSPGQVDGCVQVGGRP